MDPDASFTHEVAVLLMTWNIPQTPARLFGHLLLQQEPVSLEDIAAQLRVSRTTASDAARLMERYGFLRRHGEAGSKRVSFAPSADFTQFFLKQASYLDKMAKVMKRRAAGDLSPGVSGRLLLLARYYGRLSRAIREISEDYD